MSFAMLEGKCYCCGKAGDKSPSCRLKDKTPKEEWAINKAKNTEQSHVNSESKNLKDNKTSNNSTTNNSSSNDNTSEGWCGAHIQFYQADKMKNWILLDNGSNFVTRI
jgi:hypothetical protein